MKAPATEAHERHMANLKRMTRADQRREYIEGVKRAEGKYFGKILADDYAAWWHAEKEKANARNRSSIPSEP